MVLKCEAALQPEQKLGLSGAQCIESVTELRSYVEFHFNITGQLVIRPVVFAVVFSTQREQNPKRVQKCKENRRT